MERSFIEDLLKDGIVKEIQGGGNGVIYIILAVLDNRYNLVEIESYKRYLKKFYKELDGTTAKIKVVNLFTEDLHLPSNFNGTFKGGKIK